MLVAVVVPVSLLRQCVLQRVKCRDRTCSVGKGGKEMDVLPALAELTRGRLV